jgi:hypothetical protein
MRNEKQMPSRSDPASGKSMAGWYLKAVGIPVILLVLYVLSCGPVFGRYHHVWPYTNLKFGWSMEWASLAYVKPLLYVGWELIPSLEPCIYWYLYLWV